MLKDIESIVEGVVVYGGQRNVTIISQGNDMELFFDVCVLGVGVVEGEPVDGWGMGELDDEDLNA